MKNEEIVNELSKRMIAGSFSEVVYAIMMKAILAAIVKRMGDKAFTLSAEDLHLARRSTNRDTGLA